MTKRSRLVQIAPATKMDDREHDRMHKYTHFPALTAPQIENLGSTCPQTPPDHDECTRPQCREYTYDCHTHVYDAHARNNVRHGHKMVRAARRNQRSQVSPAGVTPCLGVPIAPALGALHPPSWDHELIIPTALSIFIAATSCPPVPHRQPQERSHVLPSHHEGPTKAPGLSRSCRESCHYTYSNNTPPHTTTSPGNPKEPACQYLLRPDPKLFFLFFFFFLLTP